jgi:hypothetical protein
MLVDSRTVFDALYLLTTFGHDTPEDAQRLDPPDDFFRVRLVRPCLALISSVHHVALDAEIAAEISLPGASIVQPAHVHCLRHDCISRYDCADLQVC